MAARSASERDWAFPRRFYRRSASAALLLEKIEIGGRVQEAPTSQLRGANLINRREL
jgi:hypothetical protein